MAAQRSPSDFNYAPTGAVSPWADDAARLVARTTSAQDIAAEVDERTVLGRVAQLVRAAEGGRQV